MKYLNENNEKDTLTYTVINSKIVFPILIIYTNTKIA